MNATSEITHMTDDQIMLEIRQTNILLSGLYLRDGYNRNNDQALIDEIQAKRQTTNKRLDELFAEMDNRYPE